MPDKKRRPNSSRRKKPESLKAIYARIRKEFSAADLQKYTVIEPMFPVRELLAELEATQLKFDRKRKKD